MINDNIMILYNSIGISLDIMIYLRVLPTVEPRYVESVGVKKKFKLLKSYRNLIHFVYEM